MTAIMGCTNCRKRCIFDDMYIYDGMFVCSKCYDELAEEDDRIRDLVVKADKAYEDYLEQMKGDKE